MDLRDVEERLRDIRRRHLVPFQGVIDHDDGCGVLSEVLELISDLERERVLSPAGPVMRQRTAHGLEWQDFTGEQLPLPVERSVMTLKLPDEEA